MRRIHSPGRFSTYLPVQVSRDIHMLYYSYSGPLSDQSVQHQFRAMVSREKAQLKSSKGRGVMLSNLSLEAVEAVEAVPEERVGHVC